MKFISIELIGTVLEMQHFIYFYFTRAVQKVGRALMLLYRRTQKFSRLRAMALARPCVRVLCWGKITDAIKE